MIAATGERGPFIVGAWAAGGGIFFRLRGDSKSVSVTSCPRYYVPIRVTEPRFGICLRINGRIAF